MRLRHVAISMAGFASFCISAASQARTTFDLENATVADINKAIDSGALTSEQLAKLLLARLSAYEPELHAVINVNPHALDEARALDRERIAKGRRSALHSIPIVLKDNINTRELPTTLGFFGLRGAIPYSDAAIVVKLHEAGAIILAKVNLSELASGPTMSSLGGQTHNPYNLSYSPAGSPSGTAVAVAAGYSPIGIGTDTTGSCRWPAATNGVVGLRPTAGSISTVGVMPTAPTMDTVGPITRSVADAALVFSVLEGVDLRSPTVRDSDGSYPANYIFGLRADSLRGARIGFSSS